MPRRPRRRRRVRCVPGGPARDGSTASTNRRRRGPAHDRDGARAVGSSSIAAGSGPTRASSSGRTEHQSIPRCACSRPETGHGRPSRTARSCTRRERRRRAMGVRATPAPSTRLNDGSSLPRRGILPIAAGSRPRRRWTISRSARTRCRWPGPASDRIASDVAATVDARHGAGWRCCLRVISRQTARRTHSSTTAARPADPWRHGATKARRRWREWPASSTVQGLVAGNPRRSAWTSVRYRRQGRALAAVANIRRIGIAAERSPEDPSGHPRHTESADPRRNNRPYSPVNELAPFLP